MEGFHYFYIVLLMVWFVVLRVVCFGLQELFEGWDHIEICQIENPLPVILESEDGESHYPRYPIFYFHAMRHCLFLAQHKQFHCSPIRFISVTNICSDYFKIFSVWNLKRVFKGACISDCHFLCNEINCLCTCISWLLIMQWFWSTNMHYIYHDFWKCVQ